MNLVSTAVPVITVHPNNNGPITVPEGKDVVLRCKATGRGTLNYQWRKASGKLPKHSKSNEGQTLTLHNLASGGNGQYYCEVDNGRIKVTSQKVQVTAKSQLQLLYNFSQFIIFIQGYPKSLIILLMYN